MSDDQFIQKAIHQLTTENEIGADKLEKSLIQDAKVVYLKIRPDAYAMMVFDSETGEQINASFGPRPFLKPGPNF